MRGPRTDAAVGGTREVERILIGLALLPEAPWLNNSRSAKSLRLGLRGNSYIIEPIGDDELP